MKTNVMKTTAMNAILLRLAHKVPEFINPGDPETQTSARMSTFLKSHLEVWSISYPEMVRIEEWANRRTFIDFADFTRALDENSDNLGEGVVKEHAG